MKDISYFLFSLCLIQVSHSKFFNTYASFDGCQPNKQCSQNNDDLLINNYDDLENYLVCKIPFSYCGYVPLIKTNGNSVISFFAGVHIGSNIDINDLNPQKLLELKINKNLIDKLTPYIGLIGYDAYEKLLENPLILDKNDVLELTKIYIKSKYYGMATFYDENNSLNNKFDSLNFNLQTSILFYYIDKYYVDKNLEPWAFIEQNHWNYLSEFFKNMNNEMSYSLIEIFNLQNKNSNNTSLHFLLPNNNTLLIYNNSFGTDEKIYLKLQKSVKNKQKIVITSKSNLEIYISYSNPFPYSNQSLLNINFSYENSTKENKIISKIPPDSENSTILYLTVINPSKENFQITAREYYYDYDDDWSTFAMIMFILLIVGPAIIVFTCFFVICQMCLNMLKRPRRIHMGHIVPPHSIIVDGDPRNFNA